jgi:hypothetical protein
MWQLSRSKSDLAARRVVVNWSHAAASGGGFGQRDNARRWT